VSRRRWIADEWESERAAITGQNARHLAQVLRAKVGQTFELAHGGELRLGTIAGIDAERVTFTLGDVIAAAESRCAVHLVMAIFKFDRFEWAIEKVTELGVSRITPVIAQRTEVHLAKAAEKRAERWRRIAHEASQQSRRSKEPEIDVPLPLKRSVDDVSGLRILLSENEKNVPLSEFPAADELTLAIGPEGGWTTAEGQLFAGAGWQVASLGATILRAETAAIAALVLAQNLR
jgi:16S rRNA (uracil1498-N3)-methyltransferase